MVSSGLRSVLAAEDGGGGDATADSGCCFGRTVNVDESNVGGVMPTTLLVIDTVDS